SQKSRVRVLVCQVRISGELLLELPLTWARADLPNLSSILPYAGAQPVWEADRPEASEISPSSRRCPCGPVPGAASCELIAVKYRTRLLRRQPPSLSAQAPILRGAV